jgi:antitoxin (DNA-binding transcriptional repressor) of toxin-antitoxin stability system
MERTITERELRTKNAAILRALDSGDSFIVTRDGIPVGRLTPIEHRTFVPTAELQASAAHLAKIDAAKFRSDIDAHIDQDPTPRNPREIVDRIRANRCINATTDEIAALIREGRR